MSYFHLGIITDEVSQDLREAIVYSGDTLSGLSVPILSEVVSNACPATILRRHSACTLYGNTDSYGEVPDERGDAHGTG